MKMFLNIFLFLTPLVLLVLTSCSPQTNFKKEITIQWTSDQLEELTMEPMLVQDSDGTIYVTGFNQQYPILFKSVDNGNTWSSVDIGKEEDGAIGDSDADLIICDNGSIHMAVMYFDSGEGRAISVASRPIDSNDWKWTTVAEKKVDRPWLESSPDGKVHLIWSDSTGVCYTRTPNDGITWEKQENISQRGESSHFAIGQKGEMYVCT